MKKLLLLLMVSLISCIPSIKPTTAHLSTATLKIMQGERITGSCSTFAASRDMLITAGHCVRGIEINRETLNVNNKIARVLKVDYTRDLALLYLPHHGLRPVPVASRKPLIGEQIWVVGSPLGIENIITTGFVAGYSTKYMILSAPAWYGNSGGIVFNGDGRIVGVLVAGPDQYHHISISPKLDAIKDLLK